MCRVGQETGFLSILSLKKYLANVWVNGASFDKAIGDKIGNACFFVGKGDRILAGKCCLQGTNGPSHQLLDHLLIVAPKGK